jgi:hypothetical protein
MSSMEAPMIPQLKRFEIQVLLKAGHSHAETSRIAKVSLQTVARVSEQPRVEHSYDREERTRRCIGRPSTAEPFKAFGGETIDSCINNATARAKKEATSIAECIRAASAVRGQAL